MKKEDTLQQMIDDLQTLVDKGYGDKPVEIYCASCDCFDRYTGATGGSKSPIQIVINK